MTQLMKKVEKRAPVLDPLARVSELIFGLLMALSFTGALSVATAGREDVRTMMYAAIGCNLAWGLVDGVMYLMATLSTRARNVTLMTKVRRAADPSEAHEHIADAMPGRLGSALGAAGLEELRLRILALVNPPARPYLTKDDLLGAVGVFFVIVAITFPVVVPFMVIQDARLALRVSNAIALIVLYFAGVYLAGYAGFVKWRAGLVVASFGAALVLAIVALGG